jgi:hypothetical protein
MTSQNKTTAPRELALPGNRHNSISRDSVCLFLSLAHQHETTLIVTMTTIAKSPSGAEEEDIEGPFSVLHEALGTTNLGMCMRHPNCPVLRPERIMSCRVCFSEEKTLGIQQRKTFSAVANQLQQTSTVVSKDKEGATDTAAAVEIKLPSLAQPKTLESVMKRLAQVQNWMVRQKEKEVMSLKLTIHRLEQRLKDQEENMQEQKDTIKELRKTMVAETQKEISNKMGTDLLQSPAKTQGSTSPVRASTTPRTRRGGRRAGDPLGGSGSAHHAWSHPSTRSLDAGVSIPEDEQLGDEASPMPVFSISPKKEAEAAPAYSDVAKFTDPNRIFVSFRGGIGEDLPTSPPSPPGADKKKLKMKIKMDVSDKQALKLPPMRNVMRSFSGLSDYSGDGVTGGPPTNRATIPTSLTLLASKLQKLPSLDKGSEHGAHAPIGSPSGAPSPPASDDDWGKKSKPKIKVDKDKGEMIPLSLLLDEKKSQNTSSGTSLLTATYSVETVDNNESIAVDQSAAGEPTQEQANNLITVSRASIQDKYGDAGIYTGTILVREGLPHGQGTMNYESGRIYDGEWVSGHWNGKGNLLNPNGDTYKGEFVFDARHGQGLYKWDNGDIYQGSFSQDKRHGKGKFGFHNGNTYEGEFDDGKFEGYGRYIFEGGYYEGEWKQGRYDGTGELMYASGVKYTGEFRDSVPHGFGMEVSTDGTKRRGLWKDGQPVEMLNQTHS